MTPESSFEMDEMEFEKELKGMGKKDFSEFRKRFREFSSEITQKSSLFKISDDIIEKDNDDVTQRLSFKDQLRTLSKKLHLIKMEFEKREMKGKITDRIKEMLKTPDEMLQIEDGAFKEAVHNMESKEFNLYVEHYKDLFMSIIDNRKQIVQQINAQPTFDKQSRDNLKIIKRWDFIEEEQLDREKRMLKIG